MALRRNSAQPATGVGGEPIELAQATAPIEDTSPPPATEAVVDWRTDDDALLAELLETHGLGAAQIARLVEIAAAPTHAKRPVDRLAIALGAQFNFFALEEAWQKPILLCGLPGAGASTLAAKLAARFDDSEVVVISAGAHDQAKTEALAECLEALDLPLTHAADAAALSRAVAAAGGRKIIVDSAGRSPLEGDRLAALIAATGGAGMLVMSGETAATAAMAAARTASAAGIERVILTHLDVARYLGAALQAADATKLALVGASITPHFGFGLRALTPENLARRLTAAVHAERWRAAPL